MLPLCVSEFARSVNAHTLVITPVQNGAAFLPFCLNGRNLDLFRYEVRGSR